MDSASNFEQGHLDSRNHTRSMSHSFLKIATITPPGLSKGTCRAAGRAVQYRVGRAQASSLTLLIPDGRAGVYTDQPRLPTLVATSLLGRGSLRAGLQRSRRPGAAVTRTRGPLVVGCYPPSR